MGGYWILDTGYWILDTGCWMLDTGYRIPDSGKSEKWPRSYGDGVPVGHRRKGIGFRV